jgi:hypothetical protein
VDHRRKPRTLPDVAWALLRPRANGSTSEGRNAVVSGDLVNAYPKIAATVIKSLLDHKVRVYYTPISLPNLILRGRKVSEMLGSGLLEFKGVDARGILYDLKWSLTRKYLKVSGTVETIDAGNPGGVLIRLRDQHGYRNLMLDSAEEQDVKIGDSLEIVASHFVGAADAPYLEAVWVEKRNPDATRVPGSSE